MLETWVDLRLACGIRFGAGMAGFVLLGAAADFEDMVTAFRTGGLLTADYHFNLVMDMLSSPTLMMAVPIAAALPYTACFADALQSGFIKLQLPRTSLMRYVVSKIAACALAGGLALLLGVLALYGLSVLLFLPVELPGEITMMEEMSELCKTGGLYFLSGMFWALSGLLLSLITDSRYMAYAAPFIAFYLLVILQERYFPNCFMLSPQEWLAPNELWFMGKGGAALWVTEGVLITAALTYLLGQRRIRQL